MLRRVFLLGSVVFFLSVSPVLAGDESVPPPNFRVTNEMIYRELMEIKLRQARMEERFEERFKAFDEKFKVFDEKFKVLEAKIEANARAIEANARAIDRVSDIFLAIFGALIALLIFVIGFAIWDRKTTVKPVRDETERIKAVLKEYGKKEPKLAEILRHFGL